jgi:hypothetical protein
MLSLNLLSFARILEKNKKRNQMNTKSIKKIVPALIIVIGLVIAGGIAWHYAAPKDNGGNGTKNNQPENKLNPLNCQYIVEGQVAVLKDGKEETTSQYGNQKVTTEIVGTPAVGDLNSDGQQDYAVVITQKTDGDVGVYYYAAVALADEKSGVIAGTVAVPLGDRIVIQDTAIVNQAFRINYLDWKTDGDAVEAAPTQPVTKTFILDGIMLKEITGKRATAQVEAECTDNGGTWNADASECKGLTKEWCEKNTGKFENDTCKF